MNDVKNEPKNEHKKVRRSLRWTAMLIAAMAVGVYAERYKVFYSPAARDACSGPPPG